MLSVGQGVMVGIFIKVDSLVGRPGVGVADAVAVGNDAGVTVAGGALGVGVAMGACGVAVAGATAGEGTTAAGETGAED